MPKVARFTVEGPRPQAGSTVGVAAHGIPEGHAIDRPVELYVGAIGLCLSPLELHSEGKGLHVVGAAAALRDEGTRRGGGAVLGDPPPQLGAFGEVVVADPQ